METARAYNQKIWLPMQPLVVSPLQNKDFSMYARPQKDATQLASQLIRGDGIFLITGYRGVGKSTFINFVLQRCAKLEWKQTEIPPWHLIPVNVSLAKASGTKYILRLCLRKMYESIMQQSTTKSLLTAEEQLKLTFAYYCSVYRINIQQDTNVETLKFIESQIGWNIKSSTLTNSNLLGLLPEIGLTAKVNRSETRKTASTIALPDYDEDKAEEDIVELIKMLASLALPPIRKYRLKLVFIFDEVDKMNSQDQEDLITQLKNLFLERNAVFLILTSKDFYYMWLDQRKKEDAVLTSYFSGITMVPLFTSDDTNLLLQRLLSINVDKLLPNELSFLFTLAHYLTYHARGIPRDIVRELQTIPTILTRRFTSIYH
jgi:hypothetical protein